MTAKSSESEARDLQAMKDPKELAKVEAAQKAGKDYGDWKYTPWEGRDHWIHDKTGESTFDLVKVQV